MKLLHITQSLALICSVLFAVSCSGSLDNGTGGGNTEPDKEHPELTVPYVKKSLFVDFTSTGCINCPSMASALDALSEKYPDEFATVALHTHYGLLGDAMAIDLTSKYMKKFNIEALPCGLINLKPAHILAIQTEIEKAILDENALSTDCGVALETSFDDSSKEASITVKVISNKNKIYRYLIFVTEDGIKDRQEGVDGEYIHNHVVRTVLSNNLFGERLNLAEPLEPGKEYPVTKTTSIGGNMVKDNMSVVATILSSNDNGVSWVCENTAVCKLGESVDYNIKK